MALWWSLQNPSTLTPVYFLKIEIPQCTDCFLALLQQTKGFCRAVPPPSVVFSIIRDIFAGCLFSKTLTNLITHLGTDKSFNILHSVETNSLSFGKLMTKGLNLFYKIESLSDVCLYSKSDNVISSVVKQLCSN